MFPVIGVVENVCQNKAPMLEQMKFNPIWIDDYNEIAAYLKYMTE